MAKIEKTITVEVCDACGKEGRTEFRCAECKGDFCSSCAMRLTVNVVKYEPQPPRNDLFDHTFSQTINIQNEKGQTASYCKAHGGAIEQRLREAGFRDYQSPEWVTRL